MKIHELISQSSSDALRNKLIRSVKFDIGEHENLVELSDLSSQTFFELPFPICTFQVYIHDVKVHYIFLTEDHGDGQITIALYMRKNGIWVGYPLWLVIDRPCKDNEYQYRSCICNIETGEKYFVNEQDVTDIKLIPDDDKFFVFSLHAMASSIEVFSCSNIKTVEHNPSQVLNKSRTRKGKVPFFSYHTLHINNQAQETSKRSSFGSHASPRLHLRRGHIRRLADGRKIWVTHCLVGDKSKGLVTKNYAVS